MIDTFFTVVEEKKFSDGSATATATIKVNRALAESAYYAILATAAADGSPYHAAYVIESNRGVILSKIYDRSENNG